MSFSLNFVLFLVVLCLICSVLCAITKDAAARMISLILSAVSCAANFILLLYVAGKGTNFNYMMGHYPHPWGNELRLGPTEALISTALSLILFLCLLGGSKGLKGRIEPGKEKYFHTMVCLLQASFLVLAYTNDIFTGYVFIEICTLASCGVLMSRQNGRAIVASVRYMIFSLIGSGLFTFGIIFLYSVTGHLLFPELKETVAALWESGKYRMPLLASACLMCIGLAIKSGLFPFHLWMADTYSAAIPAASGILSGLVSKAYVFYLIKIIFNVFGTEMFYSSGLQNVLFVLGSCGIVVGSIQAMHENNLLRMVAYSSAAQIGYIYMGIGLSPEAGIIAAIFQILNHAFTKPPLFLSSSLLSDTAGGAKKFKNLQGIGYSNFFGGAAFSLEAFSMIGLPFTMGFISKYLFAVAAFDSTLVKKLPALLVLAVSTILNTLYYARTVIRIFQNRTKVHTSRPRRNLGMEWSFYVSASLFVLLNLALGIWAKPFVEFLSRCLTIF